MSTCVGAPAPHYPCKHGERCDWDGEPGGTPAHMVWEDEMAPVPPELIDRLANPDCEVSVSGWTPTGGNADLIEFPITADVREALTAAQLFDLMCRKLRAITDMAYDEAEQFIRTVADSMDRPPHDEHVWLAVLNMAKRSANPGQLIGPNRGTRRGPKLRSNNRGVQSYFPTQEGQASDIRLTVHPVPDGRITKFRGKCSGCGPVGPKRLKREQAQADADAHWQNEHTVAKQKQEVTV